MPPSSPTQATPETSNRWVRLLAWLLVGVTFPLLWLGGLVTTTKAGMAVPDWPGTYGYNLLLYPWQTWLLGPWDLFVEHGHRLLASLAGLVTIALVVLLWRYDQRRWMRWVGVVALVGIIAQGVLGGLRVVLDERLIALVHGCVGPLFFALTVAIVVWTSSTWIHRFGGENAPIDNLSPLALVTLILVYLQMILGASLRHMPATASPQAFAGAAKMHLILAAIVALAALDMAWRAARKSKPRSVRWAGRTAACVIALQLTLGAFTWFAKYGVPLRLQAIAGVSSTAIVADGWRQTHVVTAHQATGSLLLVSVLVTLLFAIRSGPLGSNNRGAAS